VCDSPGGLAKREPGRALRTRWIGTTWGAGGSVEFRGHHTYFGAGTSMGAAMVSQRIPLDATRLLAQLVASGLDAPILEPND